MTDYWVSTEKFFCEDCNIWINARLKKKHLATEIHKHKAMLRMKREQKMKRQESTATSKSMVDFLLLQRQMNEDERKKRLGHKVVPVQKSTDNPNIGPSLPLHLQKQNQQNSSTKTQGEVPKLDEGAYQEYFKYFYEQFMEEETQKAQAEKLKHIDVESQVQTDVEMKIQELLSSGIDPSSLSFEDFMKQMESNDSSPTNNASTSKSIPTKPKLNEEGYYNDPNFLLREETSGFFNEKEKKEKSQEEERKKSRFRNKKRNKELEKEFKKKRKLEEKKAYYSQFRETKQDEVDEDTGFGSWEDVEEKPIETEVKEEEEVGEILKNTVNDSLVGFKRRRDVFEGDEDEENRPNKKLKVERNERNVKKKSSPINVNFGFGGGTNVNFGTVPKEKNTSSKKRKNVFDF